jgi:hypothetical protein
VFAFGLPTESLALRFNCMATLQALFAADPRMGGQTLQHRRRLSEESHVSVSDSTRNGQEAIGGEGEDMKSTTTHLAPGEGQVEQRLGTGALVRKIVSQAELLAKKEVELAKTELRADLRSEARLAEGLGVAALAALITVNLLLFTAALALSLVMPGWAAGLIVSGVTLIVALLFATVSWRGRLRDPMGHTRRTLKDGVKWTKERFA